MSSVSNTPSCPLCGKRLVEQSRVTQETVPATVPDYFTRTRAAPYRQFDKWTVVKCAKGHRFKQRGTGLYGMAVE